MKKGPIWGPIWYLYFSTRIAYSAHSISADTHLFFKFKVRAYPLGAPVLPGQILSLRFGYRLRTEIVQLVQLVATSILPI